MAKTRVKPTKRGTSRTVGKSGIGMPGFSLPSVLQRHPHTIYISLIAILLIIFFHQAFFEGMVFNAADNISSMVLEEGYLAKAQEDGVNAFWNPYVFSGMPTWGSSSPGHGMYLHTFLDPLKPMFLLQVYGWVQQAVNILPLPGMFWDIFNFFLLGLFTYMFGIRRKFEPYAAFFMAVSVVFTLYSLNWIMAGHNTKITVFAWLPVLLLLVDLLFEKRTLLRVALLIAAMHFSFNSGHVQMIFYSLATVGLYVLYKWYEGESPVKVLQVSAITLGAAAFAFLMLSGPYFATWEYKDFSIRGAGSGGSGHGSTTGGLDYAYATNWSFSPMEMITFWVPSFVGFGTPTYWGEMQFTESPIYMGIVISFLALMGILLSPKNKFVHFCIALGVVSLLISFGRNFGLIYDLLFNHLPFFNNFRIPSMVLFLNALAVGLLAGVGLTGIIKLVKDGKKNSSAQATLKKVLWIPVGVAALLVVIFMASESSMKETIAEEMQQNQPQYWQYVQQIEQAIAAGQEAQLTDEHRKLTLDGIYGMALDDALVALLFLVLTAGLLWTFSKGKTGFAVLQLLLLILLLADWWIVDYKPLNMVEKIEQTRSMQKSDIVDFLESDQSVFRILPTAIHNGDNWYAGLGLQSVEGYHPAKMKNYDDIRNSIFSAFKFQNSRHLDGANWALLSMLNTKYVIVPNAEEWKLSAPWLRPVFRGMQETVYENQYNLPRAFFVGDYEVIENDEAMFRQLSTFPGYQPDKIAYLSESPLTKLQPVPDSVIASANATITEWGINGMRLTLETPEEAILKLSEVYYPSGWTATLDGSEVEILRCDFALRAVRIPAGTHTLELSFEPRTYTAGLWVTTLTNYILAAVFLIYLVLWLKRRKQGSPTSEQS